MKHSRTLSDCWKFHDQKFSCDVDCGFEYNQEDGEKLCKVSIPYYQLSTVDEKTDASFFTSAEHENLSQCFSYLLLAPAFDTFTSTIESPNNVILIDVYQRNKIVDHWVFSEENQISTVCIWKNNIDELCVIDPFTVPKTAFLQPMIHQNFHTFQCIHMCHDYLKQFMYTVSTQSRDKIDICVKIAMLLNISQTKFNTFDSSIELPYYQFPSRKTYQKFIKHLKILSNCPFDRNFIVPSTLVDLQSTNTTQRVNLLDKTSNNLIGIQLLLRCNIEVNFQSLNKIDHLRSEGRLQEFANNTDSLDSNSEFKSVFFRPAAYQIKEFANECFKLLKSTDFSLIHLLLNVEQQSPAYFQMLTRSKMSAFHVFIQKCFKTKIININNEEHMRLFNESCTIFLRNTPLEIITQVPSTRYSQCLLWDLVYHPHTTFVLDQLLKLYPHLVNTPNKWGKYVFSNYYVYQKESHNNLGNLDVLLRHLTIETIQNSGERQKNSKSFSVLHDIVFNDNLNVFKRVLTKFPLLLFSYDVFDQSPLSFLSSKENDVLEWTLNFIESFSKSDHKHKKICEELVFKQNSNGHNCLMLAIQAKNIQNAKLFVERYPDLCNQKDKYQQTALMWIISKYSTNPTNDEIHIAWCELLFLCIKHSTKQNILQKTGELQQNFVLYSYGLKYFRLCNELIDIVPMALNISNLRGVLPLHSLAIYGHNQPHLFEKVLIHMDHSLWTQSVDEKLNNYTALHFAIIHLNLVATKLLIDYVPKLCSIKDNKGDIPLFYLLRLTKDVCLLPQWRPIVKKYIDILRGTGIKLLFDQESIDQMRMDNKWLIEDLVNFI